jgi:serine phosphatase RsbU (regulator of sigma subunit)
LEAPHVQLIVDQSTVPPPLRAALTRLHARVSILSLDKALTSGISPSADVCVILPGQADAPDVLDRLLADASDRACGTLVLDDGHTNGILDWTPPVEHGADRQRANGSGRLNADEIAGRLQTLCEIRHPMRRLRDELSALRLQHDKLAVGARAYEEQLQLASQVQRDLLPAPVRFIDPLTIHTLFLPADRVSGDIYDISRLDEHSYSFSIADATGHGLPAALLTVFVKNLLRGKEILRNGYLIIEPDELLGRLNRELLSAELSQCQFVAALHAVFDRRENELRWARGGAPYPILCRPGEPPRYVMTAGGLVGTIPDQTFEIGRHRFEPGDTLLLYTDGLEPFLVGGHTLEDEAALADSPFLERLAVAGPETALSEIRDGLTSAAPADPYRDDTTAIALTMN